MTTAWNQEFRLRIMALMLEPSWFAKYDSVLIPEYFENDAEVKFVKSVITFNTTYHRVPQLDEALNYMQHMNLKPDLLDECNLLAERVYSGYDKWDLSYARDEVLNFARLQALKLAMLEAIDDIEEGNVDNIDRSIAQALSVGQAKDNSLMLVRDADLWLSALQGEDKIPTGMHHVDVMMEGGPSRKELGVILAPPNYGKSLTLVNIGFGAACYHSGANVSHITMEVTKEKLAKRYAARITFGWLKKYGDLDEYKARFHEQSKRLLHGDIDIYEASPGTLSADNIRHHLDRLKQEGFNTDCLILDSADDMKMPRGDNSFERHGENYKLLRQIAIDYNIVLWTASQTHRAALRKLTVDIDDIAESFQKAMKADTILAWCQTPEEEEDHEMRWFCAKNRDGVKHWYVRCKVHDQAHAITSMEILWGNDLLKEQTDKRKVAKHE